jgi:hypothetical protein
MHGSPFVLPARLASARDSTVIDFTDGCLVMAIGCAIFWAVDPFTLQLWRHPLLRHVPGLIAIGSVLLSIAGRLIFRPHAWPQLGASFRTYLGLTLFAIFAIAGSLYARFVPGIGSTYFSMGAYAILGGPVYFWILRTSSAPLAMIRSITFVFVTVSLLAVIMNAARFDTRVFHSLEHVVLVAAAFPLLAGRNVMTRAAGAAFVILGAVAQNKLTGYIVMLLIFAWVYADWLMLRVARDADRVRAHLRLYLGVTAAVLGAIAALIAYEFTRSLLPGGNLEYRLHTYGQALDRFLDSWMWGRAFAAPAVEYFDLFVVNTSTQYLPTHNDPLDILANGGLLAAVPFALGLLAVIAIGWKALSADWSPGGHGLGPWRPHLAMYFLIALIGIVVMTFNPVLNEASIAHIYWTSTAAMCALVAGCGGFSRGGAQA